MSSTWRRFCKEFKRSASSLTEFIRSHKGVIIVLALALIFVYGQKMFYYDISIDSEIALNNPTAVWTHWISIDRFGLVVTKYLFGATRLVPATANYLMVVTLGATAVFLDFCISEWNGEKENYKIFYYIFPVLYISSPCLAEQFNFTLQAFEIAWAGLLCSVSVYCIGKWVFNKGSFLWVVLGFITGVWAFGSYQAFVAVFITFVVIAFILAFQNENIHIEKCSGWLVCGIKFISVFVINLIGYKVASKLVQLIVDVQSTSYVDEMNSWSAGDIGQSIQNIVSDINRIYFAAWDVFFQYLFLPVLIASLVLILYRGIKIRRKGFAAYVAAAAILASSPLLLTIVTGTQQPIRGQLVYPFVYAFCFAFLTTIRRKILAAMLCIVSAFAALHQGQTMTRLFYTAHMTYEYEVFTAAAIYEEIDSVGTEAQMDTYTVLFVGSLNADLPDASTYGDVIGQTFFAWDLGAYYGATVRIMGLMSTLGYGNLETPTEEQAANGYVAAEDMPIWPTEGSVQVVDDIIVIKLSDSSG